MTRDAQSPLRQASSISLSTASSFLTCLLPALLSPNSLPAPPPPPAAPPRPSSAEASDTEPERRGGRGAADAVVVADEADRAGEAEREGFRKAGALVAGEEAAAAAAVGAGGGAGAGAGAGVARSRRRT